MVLKKAHHLSAVPSEDVLPDLSKGAQAVGRARVALCSEGWAPGVLHVGAAAADVVSVYRKHLGEDKGLQEAIDLASGYFDF